jgi:hypothetical protein
VPQPPIQPQGDPLSSQPHGDDESRSLSPRRSNGRVASIVARDR